MATTEATLSSTRVPGPGFRERRRENDDLYTFYLSGITTGVTFTPFGSVAANGAAGVNKGFPRAIYDWALKPVSAFTVDNPSSTTAYSSIPVSVGNGVEMALTYTPPTATDAGFFTFTCTAGSGIAVLYVWAK